MTRALFREEASLRRCKAVLSTGEIGRVRSGKVENKGRQSRRVPIALAG